MKRLISILFLLLLLLQGIPVLHAFSSEPHRFYVSIDEDKPSEQKEVKDGKEYPVHIDHPLLSVVDNKVAVTYKAEAEHLYANPYLEFNSPPPDTY